MCVKNVALYNLGCKVNSYETELMRQMFQEKGYEIVPFDKTADIYIVNTCTVTGIADRKSRQLLHRARRLNPQAVVVAVGCYVQAGGGKDDSIDLAVGNDRKKDIVETISLSTLQVQPIGTDVNARKHHLPAARLDHSLNLLENICDCGISGGDPGGILSDQGVFGEGVIL